MKSSAMLEALDTASRDGQSLPAGLLRLCADRGSARVKDRLFRLIERRSVVISTPGKEFAVRYMLAHIRETFDPNALGSFDAQLQAFLAELDNYQIDDPLRTELVQSLLTFIDAQIVNDMVRHDMEPIVIERLVTDHREIADRKRFAYSDQLWRTIVSANAALRLPRIG